MPDEAYLCLLFFLSCVVGLDAAGKTTILYKLKLGEVVTTIPTIGRLEIVCSQKLSTSPQPLTSWLQEIWHLQVWILL